MKLKSLIAGAMAVCLAVSMTACGKSDSGGDSARPTIKWLTTGDSSAPAIGPDDRIVAAIEDRLGINLEVIIAPENNTEKINVQMASGDFPDVVTGAFGTSATQQWIDDGMVIALNDYFDANSSMKSWCEDDYAWTATDGLY